MAEVGRDKFDSLGLFDENDGVFLGSGITFFSSP
jgi:hypothetical protein